MATDHTHIRKHIFASYFNLRIGMGLIGIALPIAVWLVAFVMDDRNLLPSISAYYHSHSRDVFVGSLFAIGAAAYLYKGYSQAENIAMNLAGIFAVGVAAFPTDCPDLTPALACESPTYKHIHVGAAILFFLMIAYVALFRAKDTLKYVTNEKLKKRYQLAYYIIGASMIILPTLVAIQAYGVMSFAENFHPIFWMEALAIWSFAAFWLVKSHEIKHSSYDTETCTTPN